MSELEDFIGCTINHDLTKTTRNIFQPYLINKMNQGFNKYVKSPMIFNTPDKLNKEIIHFQ